MYRHSTHGSHGALGLQTGISAVACPNSLLGQVWLTEALGRNSHLIQQQPMACRATTDRDGKGFFNEGQYLVISDASVSKVEQLVAEQGTERLANFNYRPNLVLSGAGLTPFAEAQTPTTHRILMRRGALLCCRTIGVDFG